MAVTNPRNRTVIFRLTQGEYESLLAASSENGSRSLSDFARTKLLGAADGPALGADLSELKLTVARIAHLLSTDPRGGVSGNGERAAAPCALEEKE